MTIEDRFDMILLVGEKHRPIADIAQVVVRILGKDEVTSSSLVISCNEIPPEDRFFRGFFYANSEPQPNAKYSYAASVAIAR